MEISDSEDSPKSDVFPQNYSPNHFFDPIMLPAFQILMNDSDMMEQIEFKPNVMDLQPQNAGDPANQPVTGEQLNQLKLLCRAWLLNFTQYREECLRHCVTKLHALLLEQIRQERTCIRNQYIAQLEENRQQIINDNIHRLYTAIAGRREELHYKIRQAKKKQWCWVCERPSSYYCCWNTTYCSTKCQAFDWKRHRLSCRRKVEQEQIDRQKQQEDPYVNNNLY